MPPILTTCCCWSDLRRASVASAIYTMVVAVLNGGYAVYGVCSMGEQMELYRPLNISRSAVELWITASLVCNISLILVALLLIYGITKDERHLLLPWLVVMVAVIVESVAAHVYQLAVVGLHSAMVITTVMWLVFTVLHVYCILCVVSQYQIYAAAYPRSHGTPAAAGYALQPVDGDHPPPPPGPDTSGERANGGLLMQSAGISVTGPDGSEVSC